MTLCVYALAAGGARVSGRGVSGERLRVVRSGSLAAIVGTSLRQPSPTPANLRAYNAVLERVAMNLPAVLPARFMTRVADENEVRFVLQSRRESLTRAMRRVRRRAQMTVRMVSSDGAAGAAEMRARRSSQSPRHAGPPTGAAYLRARARRAAEQQQVPAFEPLRLAVARWVREERIERRLNVTTVYHLVPRGSVAAYRRALDRAATANGVRLLVSGPYLPFAFTASELDLHG